MRRARRPRHTGRGLSALALGSCPALLDREAKIANAVTPAPEPGSISRPFRRVAAAGLGPGSGAGVTIADLAGHTVPSARTPP